MMYLSHLNSLNSWWCIGLFVTWQVRWDDESQYHQEIESVYVGGRLSFLLPPPAGMVIGLFETECDAHTHTHQKTPLSTPHRIVFLIGVICPWLKF